MQYFELSSVAAERERINDDYFQFLNAGSMSLAVFVLPAGAEDTQQPHAEDEIYYIVSGRASIRVTGDERPVGPGSIIFVAKEVDHRFLDISETLTMLVFFAPEHLRV